MAPDTALWALLAAAIVVSLAGLLKYRTLINPLTVSTVTDTTLTTLLPGVFAYHFLSLGKYSEADIVKTAALSGLYLFGTALPYVTRRSSLAHVFEQLLGAIGLRSPTIGSRFSVTKFGLLLLGGVVTFAALAIFGRGGVLWLTSPRVAYLLYRTGAGQFWLMTSWFLTTALLYYLWSRRPRGLHLVIVLAAFTFAAGYLGSKAIILTIGVIGVVYYHFLVRHIHTLMIVFIGVGGAVGFVSLLLLQGSVADLVGVASYFENFQITAEFIGRFREFGYQYGKAWLSSFWFYVPRALYAAKPLEYGPVLLQKQLLPGAYEAGYAPGFLNWSLAYLDFGWVGVLVAGILKGLIERAGYEQFLRNRNSLFAFAMMMQISLWGIFAFASVGITVVWCAAQAVFLRLVLVHTTREPRTEPAGA
jgi:hypothetical protein